MQEFLQFHGLLQGSFRSFGGPWRGFRLIKRDPMISLKGSRGPWMFSRQYWVSFRPSWDIWGFLWSLQRALNEFQDFYFQGASLKGFQAILNTLGNTLKSHWASYRFPKTLWHSFNVLKDSWKPLQGPHGGPAPHCGHKTTRFTWRLDPPDRPTVHIKAFLVMKLQLEVAAHNLQL